MHQGIDILGSDIGISFEIALTGKARTRLEAKATPIADIMQGGIFNDV
jgi:preprotein translocase subunit SecB